MAANHHGILHEENDSEDAYLWRRGRLTSFLVVMMHSPGHHVHFPEDISANTEIQIQMKGDSIANVHLGFLQHKHKYQIQLNLPISPKSTSLTPIINTPFIAVGNVNSPGDDKCHEVTLELDAHKEGLLRDKFVLKNEAGEEFVIVLHARVLGSHKGTPMLKEGIHCIHHAKDEEEDHSDWQGFD